MKIDKGIPLPPQTSGRTKYPWRELEVGDSFFYPGSGSEIGGAFYHAQKTLNIKLIRRSVTEDGVKGIRVWRIE